jgi:putative acetyltransferase
VNPVIIRPQRDVDAPAVRRVLIDSFGEARVADLAAALRARPDRGPAFVAEDDEIIGHVQLSRSWVDAARQLVDVLVLSPLAVTPRRQKQGIGTALVAAALSAAGALATPLVFLEGDPDYYARLGWQPAGAHGFIAPSARIPDAAFQVVLLPGWQSWMTGALVYNDTFWALDCVGLRPDAGPVS